MRLAIGQPILDKNTVYFLMENMRVAKVVDAIGCDVNQVAVVIYAEGNAVWFGVSLTWFPYTVQWLLNYSSVWSAYLVYRGSNMFKFRSVLNFGCD